MLLKNSQKSWKQFAAGAAWRRRLRCLLCQAAPRSECVPCAGATQGVWVKTAPALLELPSWWG